MNETGFKIERQYVTTLTMEQVNALGYIAKYTDDGGILIPVIPEAIPRIRQTLIDNLIIPRR